MLQGITELAEAVKVTMGPKVFVYIFVFLLFVHFLTWGERKGHLHRSLIPDQNWR